jgi:hypothetical protein
LVNRRLPGGDLLIKIPDGDLTQTITKLDRQRPNRHQERWLCSVMQKFDDGVDEVCFADSLRSVIATLKVPASAIETSLGIPGLGLTYASKLLRFLDPQHYGALDGRIRKGLTAREWIDADGNEIRIYDSSVPSMVKGYCSYLDELTALKRQLHGASILCPESAINKAGQWRLADIEMALFQYLTATLPLPVVNPDEK